MNVLTRRSSAGFDTGAPTVPPQVNLSRIERGLLDYLRANTGRILSREEMAANIWKLKLHPRSRTIDQTVSNVRRKSGTPDAIVTRFGQGYEFRPVE